MISLAALREILHAVILRFWRGYFGPRHWEANGSVYESLGVRRAKELYFGGRYMNAVIGALRGRRYRPFTGEGWAQEWMRFTVVVEIGHTLIGLYMLALGLDEALHRAWRDAASTFALNFMVNAYPVMIQRYNRARLVRVFGLGDGGE